MEEIHLSSNSENGNKSKYEKIYFENTRSKQTNDYVNARTKFITYYFDNELNNKKYFDILTNLNEIKLLENIPDIKNYHPGYKVSLIRSCPCDNIVYINISNKSNPKSNVKIDVCPESTNYFDNKKPLYYLCTSEYDHCYINDEIKYFMFTNDNEIIKICKDESNYIGKKLEDDSPADFAIYNNSKFKDVSIRKLFNELFNPMCAAILSMMQNTEIEGCQYRLFVDMSGINIDLNKNLDFFILMMINLFKINNEYFKKSVNIILLIDCDNDLLFDNLEDKKYWR